MSTGQKSLELRRYPIGRYTASDNLKQEVFLQSLASLGRFPRELRQLMESSVTHDLEARYRPGGWSVRQLLHHIADSHMNAYLRIKLALTEDMPTIKAYREEAWAELPDTDLVPIEVSLRMIESLHQRLVALLGNLNTAELRREFYHPENDVRISVAEATALYAWHGQHHLAHIRLAFGMPVSPQEEV